MNGRSICPQCDDVCVTCDGTGECWDCEGTGEYWGCEGYGGSCEICSGYGDCLCCHGETVRDPEARR